MEMPLLRQPNCQRSVARHQLASKPTPNSTLRVESILVDRGRTRRAARLSSRRLRPASTHSPLHLPLVAFATLRKCCPTRQIGDSSGPTRCCQRVSKKTSKTFAVSSSLGDSRPNELSCGRQRQNTQMSVRAVCGKAASYRNHRRWQPPPGIFWKQSAQTPTGETYHSAYPGCDATLSRSPSPPANPIYA